MVKLNNKGMTILEILVTFTLIMAMVVGMFAIILTYRDKASLSLKKYELLTFKNTLTKDIQEDILKYGLKEINVLSDQQCSDIELGECIQIRFQNDEIKVFGVSKISFPEGTDRDIIKSALQNKYLYYDGIKYKLKDQLPESIPDGRDIFTFQNVVVVDSNIISSYSVVLDDGTVVDLYSINVYISYVDFDDDFGIHITATTKDISKM